MSRYANVASNASRDSTTLLPDSTAKGASMYPAWATDDQASNRTGSCCRRGATLPTVMVRAAPPARSGPQVSAYGHRPYRSTWINPTRPAALDTTDRYAATGTGAPTYVSGTQTWNGTAAT